MDMYKKIIFFCIVILSLDNNLTFKPSKLSGSLWDVTLVSSLTKTMYSPLFSNVFAPFFNVITTYSDLALFAFLRRIKQMCTELIFLKDNYSDEIKCDKNKMCMCSLGPNLSSKA